MKGRLSLLLLLACALAGAQTYDPSLYSNLKWRSIGPFRGGRSLAAAGSVARPNEYYFGATGGGVWKTTDGGENWACVSDGFFNTASVGALAISPSNPDIVYAGMGERDVRGNISHGDGVYKTSDGGKTWQHLGLAETQNIARITVHPTNPDVVYVAALGHVYGRNKERGVYKTTDGGKTWQQVLFVSDRAGAVHITMDPSNPETLFASTWEVYRTPYTLSSGGPGSKLFKTTDGGRNWTDLSRTQGMPKGMLGKIGVSVSPVNPKVVYAIVEAAEGGILRSNDGGLSWELTNSDRQYRQRAWYYTHIHADPKNVDTVYVLNVGFARSTDGGKRFTGIGAPHSDHHDLWIAADNPERMINANDGGANVSTNGGRSWTAQDFPTSQFYHVTTDNAFPYRVYGAQQDNSTIRIWSRTRFGGIANRDWESTAGGESGYIAPDPLDPEIVYGGSYNGYLERLNHRTGESRDVNPWPDIPMGHGAADLTHRFQWTFPIVFSPHDPTLLYTCSQYVLKTNNGGQTWMKISPDLTRNDKSKMGPSGGPITKDNTSVEYYGTVFALGESPLRPGILWAGSDDGLVHVSRDAGVSWQRVTPAGMPEWGLVSSVEPSRHGVSTAFIAVDNHENDDFRPYIYRTDDFGKTWKSITSGIPESTFVRVVREDPAMANLLYAGTERGVYVSFDGGAHWAPLQNNLPVTPIHDLTVKDDDLVVATHGRAFWILDDITPLRQLGQANGAVHLFKPRDTYRVRWGRAANTATVGENAPSGFVVNYLVRTKQDKVTVDVLDRSGKVVGTATGAAEPGLQRVAIYPSYTSFDGFPGMILWAGGRSPIAAPPGEYTVRLTSGTDVQSQTVRFVKDPRISATDADLMAQFEFSQVVAARVQEANNAVVRIREIKKAIGERTTGKDGGLADAGKRLADKLSAIEGEIYQVRNQSFQDPLNYPIKLNDKIAGVLSTVQQGEARPTDQSYEVFNVLSKELQVQLDALNKVLATDFKSFNERLKKAGLDEIK